ncbi:MAG: endonuclease/exonuclease/phosphatase family protein [Myxococcota bacterium]
MPRPQILRFAGAFTALCVGVACVTLGARRPTASPPSVEDDLGCLAAGHLRLMTLNLAHGRGLSFHQLLLSNDAFAPNIAAIGELLRRVCPDVVALQEADGPSIWSGNFDHVATLAQLGGLGAFFRGTHARVDLLGADIDYGTALLVRGHIDNPTSLAFKTSDRDTKGLVRATVSTSSQPRTPIDVVSVHLHPSDQATRQRHIDMLVAMVAAHEHPLVVMGDFNCGWNGPDGCAAELAARLQLQAFAPTDALATFPSDAPTQRLDWILLPPALELVDYRVLSTLVSDHRGVVADVRWKTTHMSHVAPPCVDDCRPRL